MEINKENNIKNVLYHFTYCFNLLSILRENRILLSDTWKVDIKNLPKKYNRHYISLTRNKYLYKTIYNNLKQCYSSICIDADKLSANYKIIPYSYYHTDEKREQEEAVLLKNDKTSINNIKLYINSINILNKEQFIEEITTYIAYYQFYDLSFINKSFTYDVEDMTEEKIIEVLNKNKIYEYVLDTCIEYCNIYDIKYNINK